MTTHRHEPDQRSTARYWDDFYAEKDTVWSGKPNELLVRQVADLPPGTALDLGCGEGGDALWLAERGWRVTAVDVSDVALRRGAAHAVAAGVASRITWQRHDLAESFPEGTFDLVSAQFLHSPVAEEGERESVLRRATSAVAPGGVLLIGSHAGWPSWVTSPPFEYRFPTVREIVDALRLPPRGWTVEVAELVETELPDPEGGPGHRTDSVVRVRRL
ncbi:class I SAM-dependent methyltransferase [Saccharomonospora glauca]|jgi:SAM-dependent methyltransferase|uniref:Methylase involved in ubiquinone/menaquinone biosynthesis n=1 Tax=Saccharomonospora glauca K62 TaxID=928724 RepID=I1D243_9PSEU|nr:class I SAM-dependent methyltransferase [Saccharomonospora glauca]EIE99017.1 methylase involved in ubiquinone/menaquinone biosynthesis [Saccharomonospora glauca K62]